MGENVRNPDNRGKNVKNVKNLESQEAKDRITGKRSGFKIPKYWKKTCKIPQSLRRKKKHKFSQDRRKKVNSGISFVLKYLQNPNGNPIN